MLTHKRYDRILHMILDDMKRCCLNMVMNEEPFTLLSFNLEEEPEDIVDVLGQLAQTRYERLGFRVEYYVDRCLITFKVSQKDEN